MKQQWMVYSVPTVCFDYLKAHHKKSPDPKIEETMMLFTSDIPSYTLPGLNIKCPDKTLSRQIVDNNSYSIYGDLMHTLICMLENQGTTFYRYAEEFRLSQRDFVTYMNDAIY